MKNNASGEQDFMSTPITEIWTEDIEWIKNRIFFLETEGRLCKGTGEEVIAEFGFKGNYDSVLQQLKELLETVKETPYTEIDKFKVRDRLLKFSEYKKNYKDSYDEKQKEAIKKYTLEGLTEAVDISIAKHKLQDILHEKKECICFLN